MSRQDPTTAEQAKNALTGFVGLILIPGVLGFVAMLFVGYVMPSLFEWLNKGVAFPIALEHALNGAGERLGLFLDDSAKTLYSLGIPVIGAVIGIVISIAKSDD